MNYANSNMQEAYENTKNWLQNMNEDELNELAVWLVDNGYGTKS